MLRITVHDEPGSATFRLDGKLAGSWVQELQDCWQNYVSANPQSAVRFDLTEVTFIDAPGKTFLAARYAQGAEMIAGGCFMKAMVYEIANRCRASQS